MTEYEIVIGMEAHAQLLTRSKVFCGCSANYVAAPPNTLVCPVCLGLPGSLPTVNQKALEYIVMVGLALGCKIREEPEYIKWDRKNYHYPDLPKGYQISQYDLPIAYDGEITIALDGKARWVRIRRVHLEEDTAKLLHTDGSTLIDFNRSGVPLIEIVTEPDLRSPREARAYAEKLRQILRWLGVSSGNMEEGSLRLEANISLRPKGSSELRTRVEIKNLNSFRAVERALAYEVERQRKVLESGGKIEQETMGWDEAREVTVPQRSKEYAEDYRYFPEPDIPPLVLSRELIEDIRSQLPELPDAKKERFMRDYGLTAYDAELFVAEWELAEAFEEYVAAYPQSPKMVVHWMTRVFFPYMNETGEGIGEIKQKFTPGYMAKILVALEQKLITYSTATEISLSAVAGKIPTDPVSLDQILNKLARISDAPTLNPVIAKVVAENPKAVADYLKGKETVLRFLIGQVAKATGGKADPEIAKQMLIQKLKEKSKEGGGDSKK